LRNDGLMKCSSTVMVRIFAPYVTHYNCGPASWPGRVVLG